MNRRVIVGLAILCIAGLSIGLFLTYKMWGYGIFPGNIKVYAYTQDPTPTNTYPIQSAANVQIYCDGRLLGNSSIELQITSGWHTISFGAYSSEYEPPTSQSVLVKPSETTYINVNYQALYGYLVVDTKLYNEYYENTSSIQAGIMIDGDNKGTGYVALRLNFSDLGSHQVSFSNIDGCIKPTSQTVSVTKATTIRVTGTYKTILTSEQEIYVFCRKKISGYAQEINATSNIVTDQFKRWIRDNRVATPKCYVDKARTTWGEDWPDSHTDEGSSPPIEYLIARYAGIYQDDQVRAAVDIFNRLNSSGINLRTQGGMWREHYSGDSEYIITVHLEFAAKYVNVEGNIHKFKEENIDSLPDLSTNIEAVGIGFGFSYARQVYVTVGSSTVPFEEKYVPPFVEFSNLEEYDKGWFWAKWKKPGYSYDPRELFKALRMEEY